MNATLLKALLAFVPIVILLLYSGAAFICHRATWSSLLLVAALCLGTVVFTHVAEALHLFPAMGWGELHSVGHYVDLASAICGVSLLAAGVVARLRGTT